MAEELNLHSLKPAQPRKDRKRVGRGMGSGKGRYSGRGIKGQKSRSGSHYMPAGFEGGQMPIDMRLPKLRGNTSADAMPIGPFRTSTQPVNLRDLEARFEAGAEVTPEALVTARLIKNTKIDIKILGSGELTKKLSVTAHGFSKTAKEKIEAAGGTVTLAARRARREEAEAVEGRRPRIASDEVDVEDATEPVADRGRGGNAGRAATRRRLSNAELARQRLARPGAPAARSSSRRFVLAVYRLGSWMPAPGVDVERDREATSRQRRLDPRPAQPLLGRRAVAVLALRARDHAVRHGVDHRPAPDGRDPAARPSSRRRARPATPRSTSTRATSRSSLAALQAFGYAVLFQRQDALQANAGRMTLIVVTLTTGTRAPDVARRADHEARHRQRHLDPHLRLDPDEPPARHQRLVERRPDGAHLLPADRGRASSPPSSSSRKGSAGSRSSTRSGWSAAG